jgi:PAS domain S-box-containing protein
MSVETQDPTSHATPGRLVREQIVREAARISAELTRQGISTDPFASAVRATRMPMIITNPRIPDNPVVFANEAFCRLTGYAREEIIGRNCRFLQGPDTDAAVRARIRAAVADAQPLEIDVRNYRRSGELFWNRLLMAPVHDGDGELAYFFASQVDVTLERERLAGLESHNAALMAEVAGRLRAQQESEERLRFATTAGRLGIWELDLQTDRLTASTLCREHFGRDPALPFTTEQWHAATHPGDRDRVRQELDRSVASAGGYDMEYRVLRPDGDTGWVHLRAQVVLAIDGTPLRMAGISLDVTQRRLAEDELRRTSTLLRTILRAAPALIYAKDLEGRMLLANPPVLDLIGKPWAEVERRTDQEFLDDPGSAAAVMTNDRRVILEGRTQVVEERVGEHAGRPRVWLSTKTPLRDPEDAVVGLVGVSLDITDRKFAEEALQDLNATLEARVAERTRERDRTWNNAQDLLVVLDLDGILRAVNPAWTKLLGWEPAELIGRSILEFVHPDDYEPSREILQKAAASVLPHHENRYRHQDGTYCWIQWAAAPEGDLIYGSGRNVTAEKHQAEALARAEDALRQAQKMEAVGQLTGGIAHDFNNLLTGITGSLELVQRRIAQGRTEGLERFTSAAIGSAQRAAALTQRLLAFARRQPLDPKRVQADRLIAGMEDLLRRTLGPAVDLELVMSGGLWSTLCDPNQLESALLNLAINARDAMPAGGRLTIETANARLDDTYARTQGGEVKAGQYVCISATDTGTGMPPEVVAKAFDPFFTTKPTGQGTGLGLSMLYGFVKQSEGHVRIYSEMGEGTSFKLYLPRHRETAEETLDDPASKPAPNLPSADGEVVLVVDDEAAVRMLVVETLRELGYAAIEHGDGGAALRVLQSNARIDLLVTDVGLPGLNGRQLADAARVGRPNLRVLFMTGYAHNAAVGNGAAFEPGMEIITKPFPLDALAIKIRSMIES